MRRQDNKRQDKTRQDKTRLKKKPNKTIAMQDNKRRQKEKTKGPKEREKGAVGLKKNTTKNNNSAR